MATWLLLHGAPLSPAVWADTAGCLVEEFEERVLVPDCTSVPPGDAQAVLADQVADQVANQVVGPVDVVGHSFGGQVALELALRHSALVRTLTVLCSRDTPFSPFADVAATMRAGQPPSVDATLDRWFTGDELRAAGRAVRLAREDLARASPPDWASALDAIATFDASHRVPSLRVPLVLHAAGGDLVSTPSVVQDLAGRVPGATCSVHEAWRHMSPFVDPLRLARLLRQHRDAAS